ncbi:MAG: hypothetical protein P9M15_08490, partial [Candidatus Electryoneaceae bacterium]|nr:hypothetical protein [Candidatus Electryoneaceae bacterium]
MCGIIGYIGWRDAVPVLMEGLKRMEYRGYDSSGLAVWDGTEICITKTSGKIIELDAELKNNEMSGYIGLGHTRWATHGEPNQLNAHPHSDDSGKIVVIHNGIIENYRTLKTQLTAQGHTFHTDTDTEVLANLIAELYDPVNSDLESAVREALKKVNGTYGLAVFSRDEPDKLVVARLGSP